MYHNFFKKVNIPANNIHIPNGISVKQLEYCEQYESLIKNSGGIDLQILGIGRDGHIAFNEPSSSLSSRTRIKTLTQKTIKDNSRFFKNISDVPRFAITMGVGTIMEAKKIILLASGSSKAEPIAQSVEGPITSMHSASAIQLHPNTTIVVDRQASKELKEKKYYNWVYKNKNVIYNQSYN
jgi:glucosamine-6-phosphate deaminase